MKFWNGYSWRDQPTTPISLESIEAATIHAIGLDRLQMSQLEQNDYEQKLSGVALKRHYYHNVGADRCGECGEDYDHENHHTRFDQETMEQTMLSHAPGVQYDEEDHGRGLPNE